MTQGYTWLASYPKSGNTWFRMVVANLHADGLGPADINNLPERGGIASARSPFDNTLLIESGMLTHEECDRMRPLLYRALAKERAEKLAGHSHNAAEQDRTDLTSPLVKCHDAWTTTDRGEPLLGGAQAAKNAILIVRDPRDVAVSLANHLGSSVNNAIAFMGAKAAPFCANLLGQPLQLRQQLLGWSGHAESWLSQSDIPVHLVRYEDMELDPVGAIHDALVFAQRDHSLDDVARAVDLSSFARLQAQERVASFREAPRGRTFFRRGISGAWRDELTPEQVNQVEFDHGQMMQKLGYSPINSNDYNVLEG